MLLLVLLLAIRGLHASSLIRSTLLLLLLGLPQQLGQSLVRRRIVVGIGLMVWLLLLLLRRLLGVLLLVRVWVALAGLLLRWLLGWLLIARLLLCVGRGLSGDAAEQGG